MDIATVERIFSRELKRMDEDCEPSPMIEWFESIRDEVIQSQKTTITPLLNTLADDLDVCADYHGDSHQDELFRDVIALYRALGIERPKRKKDFWEDKPQYYSQYKGTLTTEELWQLHEKELDGATL